MNPRDEHAGERIPPQDDAGGEMARYGITRVPADMFHYREYRYGKLSDAIAQAKRDTNAAPEEPK